MDFNTKLQQLRTKKGLTQEQLAEKVCVSRVAVSKWEAGRGYPNLDSLKMLAKVFDVSIDSLLSSEELLDIAEVHRKNESNMFRSLLFGIMDFMTFLMFVLPVCANRSDGKIFMVTLQSLRLANESVIAVFIVLVSMNGLFGALELALQNVQKKVKQNLELILSGAFSSLGIVFSCMMNQPYACVYYFSLFLIKVLVALRTV
ncbi:MAG: helix-turn-helix transcriptional regulator [Treponema sp.]|nr:helix-turn-helix transcriptional regulator [Treponema sp.]